VSASALPLSTDDLLRTPSVDPFLTSVYAREIVRGMQGGFRGGNASARYYKTITTPKHFVGQIFEGGDMGNGTTMDRTRNDSRISIQDLEGYYLRPFRAAMVDGGSGSVMCAYSEINAQPMCANQFINNRMVRGKVEQGGWGWDGFYSSDCDSIQTMEAPGCPQKDPGFNQQGCSTWPGHNFSLTTTMTVSDGLRGGADTNCGYSSYKFAGMDAVQQGLLDNATLETAIRRTMRAIFLLGLYDPADAPGQHTHYTFEDVGTPAHRQLALEAAQQSLAPPLPHVQVRDRNPELTELYPRF
jgi:beta-glucosidase-like glycosyl hydrolase